MARFNRGVIARALAVPAALMLVAADQPPQAPDFGPMLERFTYPWPVQTIEFDIAGAPAQMAFMDIAAARPNGRTVVLLHGKNFCGATWEMAVERLVLVNPLGLRDSAEQGVPYVDVETLWAGEKKASYARIKAYQLDTYYHGTWKPAYDRWVWMVAGMYQGAGRDTVALAQAKTSEMIRTQPVAHELGRITPPTTMIVGTLDRTAFGRAQAPADLKRFLESVPMSAPRAVRAMPNATLLTLDGLGHSPQVEDPARFERALLKVLG